MNTIVSNKYSSCNALSLLVINIVRVCNTIVSNKYS